MICPTCSNSVPKTARFCPKCGSAAGATAATQPSFKRHDSRGGIPWAAIAYLLGAVLGPAAVIAGWWWGFPVLFWAGVAVSAVIILVAALGTLF